MLERLEVADHIGELFALDARISADHPAIMPLDTPQKLQDFLTCDHQSDTYGWRDETGTLIGSISLVDSLHDTLEVLNIGVDPAHQRQGHGKKMMTFAEEIARFLGKNRITLVTNTRNPAVNFYQSLGYRIVDVRQAEGYHRIGETWYEFEKLLK